jgi:histidinol-phosphate aminotransferase
LNANENPYGPSPAVQKALARYNGYQIYPDADQRACRAALQDYTGLDESNIIVGAGADELIDLLLRATLETGDAVIDCPPTFGMYAFSTQVNAGRLLSIPRDNDFTLDLDAICNAIDADTKIIFLASPNNPSGDIVREEDVLALLNENILVVIDETYFEFSGYSVSHLINKHSNLVVLRSMSKWAGLAGLRIGYALAAPELIRLLMEIKQPYNINAAAEVALLASLGDLDYLKNNIAAIKSEREKLFSKLCSIDGLGVIPSMEHSLENNFSLSDLMAAMLFFK